MQSLLTYAIGDIHGCSDLLIELLERIDAYNAGRPARMVFLGDYIDRGPDSAGVLRVLRRLSEANPDSVVCLMGNHEAMLLAACAQPKAERVWLANGGAETLASFGAHRADALPVEVLEWLENLPTVHEDAGHYYVHAGFRPGFPAPDPRVENRLWIRESFLDVDFDFGRHVVHGHTPTRDGRPQTRPFRTNLDTGAVFGGALTAGVFAADVGPAQAFLRANSRVNR